MQFCAVSAIEFLVLFIRKVAGPCNELPWVGYRLDADNLYKCSGCGKSVRAVKQLQLHRLPSVLVLHLKRFDFTYRSAPWHLVDFTVSGCTFPLTIRSPLLVHNLLASASNRRLQLTRAPRHRWGWPGTARK